MTCPFCQACEIPPTTGKRPKTCGAHACRLAMRRLTNLPSHQVQTVRRKQQRAGTYVAPEPVMRERRGERPRRHPLQTTGPLGFQRHRLQCLHCLQAFWTRDMRQQTCSGSCAARLRLGQRAITKAAGTTYMGREPVAMVDAMLADARAARLKRERETGRREFTLRPEDVYAQREAMRYVESGGE